MTKVRTRFGYTKHFRCRCYYFEYYKKTLFGGKWVRVTEEDLGIPVDYPKDGSEEFYFLADKVKSGKIDLVKELCYIENILEEKGLIQNVKE